MGGRDDHKGNSKNVLALTPKNQLSDGIDIEFSEEFADAEDKEAQARSKAADKRVKGKKKSLISFLAVPN
ncbi:YfhD family protein [Oceanobacillus bengalensis]|uniref:YfhD family protein n=1 Tax=Oceanobacillus bengalensis TaxID=1435466 RepID=A0A494Z2T4_9BACI|nr:YfhD family protein [Oceanobacillus bengalensis]RKQ16819.1 YfhD family protein [Oceanobacillus bengalensis]